MIEQNILNLITNKDNSINDIYPIIKELHKNKIIDIFTKHNNRNIFTKNLIYYRGEEDLSEVINFFAEESKNNFFEIQEPEELVEKLIYFLERLSKDREKNKALDIEKNLMALFNLVPESLNVVINNKSLSYTIGSFGLLNIAELILKKNPNYFDSTIVHIQSSEFIEKMIKNGADLFSTTNTTNKPLYILAFDKNEATESLKELIRSKVNPNDLALEENRSYFSNIKSQSGISREKMLKSDKNWVNIYNEDGVAATIVAISGNKSSLTSLVEIKKAAPSLNSVDKEGKGIWFHAKLLVKDNMTTKILNAAAKNIPMKKDTNGYGIIAQYLINDEQINRYTRESFYLNNKELIEEFGKLIKKGKIDIEGLFGDDNSQLKIAKFLNKERNSNSASLFFSKITEALVETNKIGSLNSELTGALLLNEFTIDYKKANETVVNTIMEKKFFLELQDIDNVHKIAANMPESELEGLKRVRRMMEIFVEKEQLGALLTSKVDKKDLKRL